MFDFNSERQKNLRLGRYTVILKYILNCIIVYVRYNVAKSDIPLVYNNVVAVKAIEKMKHILKSRVDF